MFFLVYGLAPLNVAQDAFCTGGYIEKDIQQHYAGWLFYRQSALQFPLCIAEGVNWPDGLSVAYTDSIPLFATIFRIFSPLLPQTFQYFGLYTFFCFILQGGFGAILLGLFSNKLWPALLGDVFFVTSPVLLERAMRHTSLGAQFFVLAALYYYFKSKRDDAFQYKGLFFLNALAITIHPYFLPMTYAVTLAMLLEFAVTHHSYKKPAFYLLANLACTAAAGYCIGLFSSSASGGSDALYGYFGLNLNALWNPIGVNGVLWSRFLPAQNQVGGNYDAFAYLGLGVMAALLIGLLAAFSEKRLHPLKALSRHWALAAVCLVLSAFSVSNVITANGATLATLPLPSALIKLFSVFRSSGRMFWPVYYLLFILAFVLLVRITKRTAAISILVVAVALQLFDIAPGITQRREAMQSAQQTAEFPSSLTSNFWVEAAGQYQTIASLDTLQADALHLALYAVENSMTTNDPFAARYDAAALTAQQNTLKSELLQGSIRADTLYLFAEEGTFLQYVAQVSADAAWCGEVTGPQDACWYVIAPGMQNFAADESCAKFDANYPLRIADYTDALWNHGVLDSTKQTVCFVDAPFTRSKLQNAEQLLADGTAYRITKFDDSDDGWLMITLDISDATLLCGKELEIK